MKTLIKIALLILLSSILSSCRLFYQKPFVEKVHDVRIISLDPDKTVLDVTLNVNNPNRYKIKVIQLELTLLNKDRKAIGSALLSSPLMIPKKSTNAVHFRISLDTRSAVKEINHADQKVFIYVDGIGITKVLGTTREFVFEEPYEIDIREKIQDIITGLKTEEGSLFKVKRSYVTKVGLTESQIRVDFMIMNPFGLEYTVTGFPATISVDGKNVGSGELLQSLYFNEKVFSAEGSMIFKINNWKAVLNVVKSALNGEVPYAVQGNIRIRGYGRDFSKAYTYKDVVAIDLSEMLLDLLE
jgi:LEA14-like dessication related protein